MVENNFIKNRALVYIALSYFTIPSDLSIMSFSNGFIKNNSI